MNEIKRRWLSLRRAYRDQGMNGLRILWERQWIRLLSYPQIYRMNQRHRLAAQKYQKWYEETLPGPEERRRQGERVFTRTLAFLVPVYNTRPVFLEALARSMIRQTSPCWQACFYDGASTSQETIRMLRTLPEMDSRLKVGFGTKNLGISGNTNMALEMTDAPFVALCDHDDILSDDAVYWILDAAEHGADFVYSDEDKCSGDGTRFFDPHLKSDFSPEALRSGNYICHIMAMSTELIRRVHGLRTECDGSQDHDLALRATEEARCVAHIPRILYHWRMLDSSYSHSANERCAQAALLAVQGQVERLGMEAGVTMKDLNPILTYRIPEQTGVSLILFGFNGGLDSRWFRKIRERTGSAWNWIREILLVGASQTPKMNESVPVRTVQSLNDAAVVASSPCLLFLEHGLLPVFDQEWLDSLVMYAMLPWIGCVGGGIVDQKNNYLMCGYAVGGLQCMIRRFYGENRMGATYQMYDRTVRNVTAVSTSCLMIRKQLFLDMGGFSDFQSDLRSVDLGLRCMENGKYNVVIPSAVMRMRHPDRGILMLPVPQRDQDQFRQLYGDHPVEHFYSPHFEKEEGSMCIDFERHTDAPTVYTRF